MRLLLDTHALLWWADDDKRLKPPKLDNELESSNFLELPIQWQHAEIAGSLPRHHEDSFDRMLIAQAQSEELVLISYDPAFRDYEVSLAPSPR